MAAKCADRRGGAVRVLLGDDEDVLGSIAMLPRLEGYPVGRKPPPA